MSLADAIALSPRDNVASDEAQSTREIADSDSVVVEVPRKAAQVRISVSKAQ
ncbi:hypothetical protein Pmar_PMAR018639, partial [Perkinsus marinus ATCC 50983]